MPHIPQTSYNESGNDGADDGNHPYSVLAVAQALDDQAAPTIPPATNTRLERAQDTQSLEDATSQPKLQSIDMVMPASITPEVSPSRCR